MTEICIAFPRLLPSSDDFPTQEGTLRLNGGLADGPENSFPARYPWSPVQADQYRRDVMADSALLARDGSHPAFSAPFGTDIDLSSDEIAALSDMGAELGQEALTKSDPKEAAQAALILAFLQEKQCAELRALDDKARAGNRILESLLHDSEECALTGEGSLESSFLDADYSLLPSWRSMLAPFLWFVPKDCVLVVTDRTAAEYILSLEESSPECHGAWCDLTVSSALLQPHFTPERMIRFRLPAIQTD